MDRMIKDARHAVRTLIKNPAFAAIVVVTLALGIGANTAIFSVINGVLLRSLSYPDPDRLITMRQNQSLPDLVDIVEQSQSFEDVGCAVLQGLDYTGGSEPIQVQTALVNAGLFSVLGARPVTGRVLSPEIDKFGGDRVVVLTHGFWQRELGGNESVIGQTIPLSGNPYTVIGVLPSEFQLPQSVGSGPPPAPAELFVPLRVANPVAAQFRGVHFLRTYWRLRQGVTIEQAQAEMGAIDQRLAEQYPEENRGRSRTLIPLKRHVVGETRSTLLILFGAVALVLLIACANYAGLLLARAAARQQEMVVRSALGATTGRLMNHVLTESVIISLAGGAAGTVIAVFGNDLLIKLKPANLPRLSDIRVDGSVLVFALGVSLLTGIIFGLIPALSASRVNLSDALKEGGRSPGGSAARSRLRRILVVSELAIAVVLLIGAGLLIRSFLLLRSVRPGFEPSNVVTMRIELPEARYREIPAQNQYREQVLEQVRSLPGVESAMVSELPLAGEWLTHNFVIEGRPPMARGEEPELFTRSASRGYLHTMRIPLLYGRDFESQDRPGSPMVAVVNESFVREYFGGESPIGARFRWARGPENNWITIVGVAGDVKHFGLGEAEQSCAYTAYEQQDQPWKRWMYLVVRTAADQSATISSVKEQIWKVDKQIPVTRVRTMNEVMAQSIAAQRFNLILWSVFAGLAMVLSSIGVYGVISHSVAQRTHEIGVRTAVGASTADVLKLVLTEGGTLAGLGVGIGLVVAVAVTRLMSSLVYGVSPTDIVTFVAVAAALSAVALFATYLPARRASRVDPISALRYE
ncbi:MAG TPA: ABC transporter permease [Blastocatellia bacterium]|nr:ABC transporter permease [Blastocatellia bacterium]